MQLINHSPLTAGYTLGMAPDGREMLVVAVKASFSIPTQADIPPELLAEQQPLFDADQFTAEPGISAPLYEADYAPIKSRCDISVIASAYAPAGKPTDRVKTGFKVGQTSKLVDVLGDRHWIAKSGSFSISAATTFDVRPISYDIAFGGCDYAHQDARMHDAYPGNPVGIGFHIATHDELVHGCPAPSTEEPGKPVTHPNGTFQPMSFGPLGRSWHPRIGYAGTYDDDWLDSRFPFLPKDFDTRYYQSVPQDQQCDFLRGGEDVRLINLTPEGRCRFQIPTLDIPVSFIRKKSSRHDMKALIDTLVIEPDANRFTLTWRAQLPLQKNLFEVSEVLLGSSSQDWWQIHDTGKYYSSCPSDAFKPEKPGNKRP